MTKKVKLGDVATYINGYAFKPKDRGSKGLPIIRIQDLTGNSYDRGYYAGEYPEKIEINNGDILISWSASLGVYIWNRGKALLNQHIFKVVFDKLPINRNYFVYAVQYHLADMKQQTHGATMKHITKGVFEKLTIPYPDMQVQEEIAKRLNLIKNIQNKREIELKKLDDLIKARFVEMFGDVVINSKKWSVYKMSDITESRLGKMLDKKQQTGKNLFPYLANFNVQWFQFDLKELNEMDFDEADQKEFKLEEGDILVCEGGEIGRCAVWHKQIKNCFFQKALHRIRCNKEYILPDYLSWWFKLSCENHAFDSVAGAKATIAHLPGVKLKKLDVVVPPLDLQKKFVSILSQIDKSKFLYLRKDML